MQINASKFNQTQLHPNNRCYLLFGQEPMLLEESLLFIRQNTKERGFNERLRFDIDNHFDWRVLFNELQSQSLFSKQRLLECHLANLAGIDDPLLKLVALANKTPNDIVLVLLTKKISQSQKKSKWFKAVEKQGIIVGHYELKPQELQAWLTKKMQQLDIVPKPELVQILLFYNEGNLLAIWQELQKIKLSYTDKNIDVIDYQTHVEQQSQYAPYHLINAVLLGNVKQTLKIYEVLKHNGIEPLYLINTLNNELNLLSKIAVEAQQFGLEPALKPYRFWAAKATMVKSVLKRNNGTTLQKILLYLGQLERSAKGRGTYNSQTIWHGLLALLLNLSGQKIWIP